MYKLLCTFYLILEKIGKQIRLFSALPAKRSSFPLCSDMDQSNKRHNSISSSLKGAPKIAMRCDNKDDIPEGAVFITEDQALEAQYNLLQHWHPKEEIWPFLHGKKLLAGVTGMTGIVLNGQIRAFYQLSHQKIFLTLAPAILVPCKWSYMAKCWAIHYNFDRINRFLYKLCYFVSLHLSS